MNVRVPARESSDRGSAMVITLMVLALVTALSTTVAVVTIDNMIGSRKAQQAGAALAAADAGIAQAMTHLRNNGVRQLRCTSAAPADVACDEEWGSDNPVTVDVPGDNGASYEVWIEAVRPFPAHDPGEYKIHSWGQAVGPASRRVVTTVEVGSTGVPKGVFARTISGGGNAAVTRQSVFSTGCVYKRSKIYTQGTDVAYGIPAAVHASQPITDDNAPNDNQIENGQYCNPPSSPVHGPAVCNATYPFDQDSRGGDLTGTVCEDKVDALTPEEQAAYAKYYPSTKTHGVHGSLIESESALFGLFGVRSPVLSQTQVDQLRSLAQAQGNYHTEPTGWSSPDEANAVMFFDLQGNNYGKLIDLNDVTGFSRSPILDEASASCEARSLVIVIDGGNAKLNSNHQLAASLFLLAASPYGQVEKSNGTSDFIGTIYADRVNLVGTTNISLDKCFLANLSPGLLNFELGSYEELDRG